MANGPMVGSVELRVFHPPMGILNGRRLKVESISSKRFCDRLQKKRVEGRWSGRQFGKY
jgi:hypothetical protein